MSEALLHLIVLGQIPATNIFLSFNDILIASSAGLAVAFFGKPFIFFMYDLPFRRLFYWRPTNPLKNVAEQNKPQIV